jgi:hypothetical protein
VTNKSLGWERARQGLGGPKGSVVLNRKNRGKEYHYTYTEGSVISGTAGHENSNSCSRGGRCGKICRNIDGKEKSPQGHGLKKARL